MQITGTKQGVPSWAELSTTDEDKALAFYSELLGWTDDPQPMPEEAGGGFYHMLQIQGDNVAAISKLSPQEAEMGAPSHWSVYLAVDDVDATAAKVEANGGELLFPPMDVFDSGRMTFLADPTGAMVGLWQAKNHIGFGRVREHGAVTWTELITDDPKKGAEFLEAVLGGSAKEYPGMENGGEPYRLYGPDDEGMVGIMNKTPDMGAMPNAWAVYFNVNDTDEIVAKAQELGATVIAPPFDVPGTGRISWLMDPTGAAFGVITEEARS